MTSKPFSLRLSESISHFISTRAKQTKQSASDIVREAIELKYFDDLQLREQFIQLQKHPETSLHSIKNKIYFASKELLSEAEIAFLANGVYRAYLNNTHNDLLDESYLETLMKLIIDILKIEQGYSTQSDVLFYHLMSGFGIQHVSGRDNAKERLIIKQQFESASTKKKANLIAHSMQALLVNINALSNNDIRTLFHTKTAEVLISIALYGLKTNEHGEGDFSKNLKKLIPSTPSMLLEGKLNVSLNIDDLSMHIHSTDISMIMSSEAFFDVLALATKSEHHNQTTIQGRALLFFYKKNQITLHQKQTHFQVHLAPHQFTQMKASINALQNNARFVQLLEQHRQTIGHI